MAKAKGLGKTNLGRRRTMTSALAAVAPVQPDAPLVSPVPGVEFTLRGAHFPAEMPEEDWMRVGDRLAEVGRAYQWCVIDWLQYGEAQYGEKYKNLVERTGFAYGTLANWVSAGKDFDFSRRREKLDFSHYVEVKKLPPAKADALLQKAEAESWTVRQTREAAQKAIGLGKSAKAKSNLPIFNDLDRALDRAAASMPKMSAADLSALLSKIHRLRTIVQTEQKRRET